MNLRFTAAAEQVVDVAAEWYSQRSSQAVLAWNLELASFIDRISDEPRLYGRVSNAPKGREVREGMLQGFPFVVVYEILADEIVIVDVSHARMKSRPWRSRL